MDILLNKERLSQERGARAIIWGQEPRTQSMELAGGRGRVGAVTGS